MTDEQIRVALKEIADEEIRRMKFDAGRRRYQKLFDVCRQLGMTVYPRPTFDELAAAYASRMAELLADQGISEGRRVYIPQGAFSSGLHGRAVVGKMHSHESGFATITLHFEEKGASGRRPSPTVDARVVLKHAQPLED